MGERECERTDFSLELTNFLTFYEKVSVKLTIAKFLQKALLLIAEIDAKLIAELLQKVLKKVLLI